MKNLTENQVLDIFMLAYRLGEIKDMSNLLNSDMRVRALECVNNYLQENSYIAKKLKSGVIFNDELDSFVNSINEFNKLREHKV